MNRSLPCYACGRVADAMASVYVGQGKASELVASLCPECFELVGKRAALASAFLAGELGEASRLVWFQGLQILSLERLRAKEDGRAIGQFLGAELG